MVIKVGMYYCTQRSFSPLRRVFQRFLSCFCPPLYDSRGYRRLFGAFLAALLRTATIWLFLRTFRFDLIERRRSFRPGLLLWGEDILRSSSLIVQILCAEFLSLLFLRLPFRGVSFNTFSPKNLHWRKRFPWVWNVTQSLARDASIASQSLPHTSAIFAMRYSKKPAWCLWIGT